MVANEKWFGASAGFYPETIDQSLRFDRASSSYLRRTGISSAGNQDKITISAWLKLSNSVYANVYNIYSQGTSLNNSSVFYIWRHKLRYAQVVSGTDYIVVATADLRDTTNFLHVALTVDMTESSNSDKVHFYINGKREAISSGSYLSTNTDMYFNGTDDATIGANSNSSGTSTYDGYMAELNVLDGTIVGATQVGSDYILDEFGETKNGVWIPKAYSGSYGTNGFRLTFGNSSSIGEDSAGSNDFGTVNNINDYDIVPDSPTNNFCVINSIRENTLINGSVTISEGNLQSVDGGTTYGLHWTATFEMTSGKWYWEVLAHTLGGSYGNIGLTNSVQRGTTNGTGVFYGNDGKRNPHPSTGGTTTYGDSYTNGDIIGIAFDADNETVTFYKNNSSQGAVGSVLTSANGGYFPAVGDGQNSTTYKYVANFGQDSSFAGNKTAQGNKDGNGNGDFYYAPPSGFLALCSSNLPDTTLSPNQNEQASEHMNVITYTGDGASSRSLTGVGFQPDLIWYKHRSIAYGHVIYDSSRGTGEAHQRSDASIADGAYNDLYGTLTSFDSDGITVAKGDDASAPDAFFNTSSQTVVGWNWKCGGTAPTKTYKVVVVSDSGNKYRFRNSSDSATFPQSGVTLNLQEGGTYTFDLSDSTMSGHPLRFSTTSDGTHGGGAEYTTGVTTSGTAGSSGATVTITVASSAPALYYYCTNHSGMGGGVNTNTTHGSTNFDGSLKSIVQTNETAGFSIAKYTGNGTNPSGGTITLGHGLTSTPQIIFHKNRDTTTAGNNYWTVWTPFHAGTNMSFLSFTSNNTGGWNDTPMSSTVFSPPISNYGNVNNEDYICYLWHSVEGYSKIGTYEMNYNSDGTFVFCGFRPRFLVTKPIDQAGSWSVYDSARDPFNDGDANMSQWENATTEASFANSAVDFLSNGFKLRQSSDGYSNIASNTAIFMAFAEQPFKFSNAR